MAKDKQTLKKKISKHQSSEAKKNGGKINKGSKVAKDQSLIDSLKGISKKVASKVQSDRAKEQDGKISKGSIESDVQRIADSKGT